MAEAVLLITDILQKTVVRTTSFLETAIVVFEILLAFFEQVETLSVSVLHVTGHIVLHAFEFADTFAKLVDILLLEGVQVDAILLEAGVDDVLNRLLE